MVKKLKRKKFIVTADMALDKMSLVSAPAIEVGFQAFADEPTKLVLAVVNPDQQIVTGPAMIANKDIYRIDQKTGEEYYGFFDEATIKTISENFLKANKIHDVNVEHSVDVPGCFLIESWIVEDGNMDKAKSLGFTVNKGDWMVSYKINDPKVWAEIKDGTIKGFSIEGYFYERVMAAKQNYKTMSKRKLSIYARMKQFLDSFMKQDFADDVLTDGTMITCDKEWSIGANVSVVQPTDGAIMPIPDGEYQLSDGTTISCVGGAITEIEAAGTEPTEPETMSDQNKEETMSTETTETTTEVAAEVATVTEDTAPAEVASVSEDTQAQLTALQAQVDELLKACGTKDEAIAASEKRLTELSAEIEAQKAEVVKLSAQPSATSVKHTSPFADAKKAKEDLAEQRIKAIAEMRRVSQS